MATKDHPLLCPRCPNRRNHGDMVGKSPFVIVALVRGGANCECCTCGHKWQLRQENGYGEEEGNAHKTD